MKLKDHSVYMDTVGGQLSFSVTMLMLCFIGFFIIDAFEKAGFLNLIFATLKGIFAAGGLYLLFYSVFLSKMLTEKHYKKEK